MTTDPGVSGAGATMTTVPGVSTDLIREKRPLRGQELSYNFNLIVSLTSISFIAIILSSFNIAL